MLLLRLYTIVRLLDQSILRVRAASPGLAWPNGLAVPMVGFTGPGSTIYSYYTWSTSPVIKPKAYPDAYRNPFSFVPMLWGCSDSHISTFKAALEDDFQRVNLTTSRDILAFNEPDNPAQADCSTGQAAQVWRDVLEPLRSKGYRVGSPAVTNGPAGKQWMQDWLESCQGECNPDFMALHWYGTDSRDFIEHLQDFRSTFGKLIWVTEYAVMDWAPAAKQATFAEIQLFMDVTRSFMNSVDWVERYFFFGAMYDMQGVNPLNTFFDASGMTRRTGALNALGVQYTGSNGSVNPSAVVTGGAVALGQHWYSAIALESFVLLLVVVP